MVVLRNGWYLGDAAFREQLLGLVAKGSKRLLKKGSHSAAPVRSHGEAEAIFRPKGKRPSGGLPWPPFSMGRASCSR